MPVAFTPGEPETVVEAPRTVTLACLIDPLLVLPQEQVPHSEDACVSAGIVISIPVYKLIDLLCTLDVQARVCWTCPQNMGSELVKWVPRKRSRHVHDL